MNNEFLDNMVTLIDEEGKETDFEVMDSVEYKNRLFYALFPHSEYQNAEEPSDDKYMLYYIFEAKPSDSGEESYFEEVQDDSVRDELSVIFEKHFSEKL